MKRLTCRALRGACDETIKGATPEEMAENCKRHVMEMVQQGDEAHLEAIEDMGQMDPEDQQEWFEEFKRTFEKLPG